MSLRRNLQNTNINISEDFPYQLRLIRRELNDFRKEARKRGLPARLKYDKLIVNGKEYTLEQAKARLFDEPAKEGIHSSQRTRRKKKRQDTSASESDSSNHSDIKVRSGNTKNKQYKKKNASLKNWVLLSEKTGEPGKTE